MWNGDLYKEVDKLIYLLSLLGSTLDSGSRGPWGACWFSVLGSLAVAATPWTELPLALLQGIPELTFPCDGGNGIKEVLEPSFPWVGTIELNPSISSTSHLQKWMKQQKSNMSLQIQYSRSVTKKEKEKAFSLSNLYSYLR